MPGISGDTCFDRRATPAASDGRQRLIGALFVAASAAAFGAMPIFAKTAFAHGGDLATTLFLRFAIAGVVMATVMRWQDLAWPRGRNLALLLAMGGIGYVGQAYCYFSSLKYSSAGLTALLLYLYPVLVTLISAALSRRMLGALRLFAVLGAFCGTVLTVSGDTGGSATGILYGIAAAVIYSVYIVVGERVTREEGAVSAATVVMLAAAAFYGTLLWYQNPHWPETAAGWAAVVAIAIFSTVVAIAGFFAGMRRLGAADASTLSTLEPVMTIALAAIFLGETIRPVQLVGGAVILCAVVILARFGD